MNKLSTQLLPAEARFLDQAILADAVLEVIHEYGALKFAQNIPDHVEALSEQD